MRYAYRFNWYRTVRVYLDHNAGAPIRPQVRDAIADYLSRATHGNPSSVHRSGQEARRELEQARERVASLIGAHTRTIVFTSGGTESNNLAIFGAIGAAPKRHRIVTTAIEHSSLLTPLIDLESRGYEIIRVKPDREGLIDPAAVAEQINDETSVVSIGLANAEVGSIQKIGPIAESAANAGALVHLDAAQAAGRIPLDVSKLRCDLMTLSAHKLGGIEGSGALFLRRGARIVPTILGGPQESGLRAGTPNLIGAIAFGVAAEVSAANLDEESERLRHLSQQLLDRLSAAIPGLAVNGPSQDRLPNTLNLTFPGVLGETLLIAFDLEGIEVSMGSACAAGAVEPSHVLLAMGRSAAAARSSLRLSLGWNTTAEEIAFAGEIIPRVWQRIAEAEPIPTTEAA
ncbi:MAG TPA: cysteine desulfurase family protein [Candidatus Binataceae bacterium]|nr:cysteine desulfurase family protein [Candidatus Binataceae bacterium]